MANSFGIHDDELVVNTRGKGFYEITHDVARIVEESGLDTGLACTFIRHTSASLVITENADPTARGDLAEFFERFAPENEPWYRHTAEGPDDMPSHIRAAVTRTSETIPFTDGRVELGTWQGLFVFEHRSSPHRRRIRVRLVGSPAN